MAYHESCSSFLRLLKKPHFKSLFIIALGTTSGVQNLPEGKLQFVLGKRSISLLKYFNINSPVLVLSLFSAQLI